MRSKASMCQITRELSCADVKSHLWSGSHALGNCGVASSDIIQSAAQEEHRSERITHLPKIREWRAVCSVTAPFPAGSHERVGRIKRQNCHYKIFVNEPKPWLYFVLLVWAECSGTFPHVLCHLHLLRSCQWCHFTSAVTHTTCQLQREQLLAMVLTPALTRTDTHHGQLSICVSLQITLARWPTLRDFV